jgi:hypothetical protein
MAPLSHAPPRYRSTRDHPQTRHARPWGQERGPRGGSLIATPGPEGAAAGARLSAPGQRRCPIPEMAVSRVGRPRGRQMRRDADAWSRGTASIDTRPCPRYTHATAGYVRVHRRQISRLIPVHIPITEEDPHGPAPDPSRSPGTADAHRHTSAPLVAGHRLAVAGAGPRGSTVANGAHRSGITSRRRRRPWSNG